MTADHLVELRSLLEETLDRARIPGLALAVARGDRPAEAVYVGQDADGVALGPDTLYVVASITKLATALLVLRLADEGALAVDDPLGRHLPEAAAARDGVSLATLLSHTSGLPLDLEEGPAAPYEPGLDWPKLGRACLKVPLEAPPLTRVQYSNPGYGLLALVVERLSGQSFDEALRARVLEPLGVEGYLGDEPTRRPARLTDVRGGWVGTPLEPYNSRFWRSLAMPWGGLVTTLDGALRLVRAFRGVPDGFLGAATLAEATRNQAGELGGGQIPPLIWPRCPWGLGPELRGAKVPHWAPPEAASESFGHAGASGCLAWADPAADLAWAFVGTRTASGGWLVRQGPRIGAAILGLASGQVD